ncbi:MAG: peptidoglycan DD-metalloendopeptidase family protein [Bacteroidales bacterium]|nr:peptidoglycan DD-metalloendopeptidase family protein [Bacteroidales bacterium]
MQYRHQNIPKWLFLWVFILGLCFYSPVYGQKKSSSQLKQDKQRLEKEIANTQSLLKKTEKNQQASLQQAAVLRQQINNREKYITTLNNEILQIEVQQEDNQQAINVLQKKLEYMKTDYAQMVYMAYRHRRLMDKITFILAAEDFQQMFHRLRYYSLISKSMHEQVEQINNTKQELQQKNEEIIHLKGEKLNVLSGKEKEIKQLEKDRNQKTKNAEALKKKSQQLSAELKKKQQQRKQIDAAIQAAIKAEIAAANAKSNKSSKGSTASTSASGKSGTSSSSTASASTNTRSTATITLTPEEKTLNNSFVNNKGSLPWPVAKGAKVGDYGNYPHPDVPSVIVENHGIDIMTEAGTPVRAIYQGEVTAVLDVMGSKVIMIRHGEYISVYQNVTGVKVKKGDKVSTKQTIATVAKNSATNTYEMHFELWKNDAHVNPNSWLARR